MKLSACILNNNNPLVLKAIDSVYKFVDEIVLVMTAGDCTLDISKYDKIRLEYYNWNNDCASARNYAISKAKGEWALIIDSDEMLSGDICIDEQFEHYTFKVINLGFGESYSTRLFKNNGKIKYIGKAHETLEFTLNPEKECIVTDTHFIHSGFQDKELNEKKMQLTLEVLLTDFDNPLRNYHLCNSYYAFGQYEKCIKYGLRALTENIGSREAMIYIQLHNAFEKLQLVYLQKSLEIMPLQICARLKLINVMHKDNRFDLVLNELEKILTIIQNKNSMLPNDVYPEEKYIKNKIKELKK